MEGGVVEGGEQGEQGGAGGVEEGGEGGCEVGGVEEGDDQEHQEVANLRATFYRLFLKTTQT